MKRRFCLFWIKSNRVSVWVSARLSLAVAGKSSGRVKPQSWVYFQSCGATLSCWWMRTRPRCGCAGSRSRAAPCIRWTLWSESPPRERWRASSAFWHLTLELITATFTNNKDCKLAWSGLTCNLSYNNKTTVSKEFPCLLSSLLAAFPSLCGPIHLEPSHLGLGWVTLEARSTDAALLLG